MKSILCLPLYLLLGVLFLQNGWADDKILVVHSYHESYVWTNQIHQAIASVLKTSGISFRTFFMDTKRRSSEAWKMKSASRAKRIMAEYQPKVVIAVDDNAQAYFVKPFRDNSPIQFVFCGVNADADKHHYPASNVTGILERSYPLQTLRMLKAVLPSVDMTAVVSDSSPTSGYVLPRLRSRMKDNDSGVGIARYVMPATFSEWKKAILGLDSDPQVDALMVLLYHTIQDPDSQISVSSDEVMQWTLAHTRKPVVGLWPFLIHQGGLLAVAVDPFEHGRVAARMAIEILDGKRAVDIPMVVNKEGKVMVNLKNNTHIAFDSSVDIDQVADVVIR